MMVHVKLVLLVIRWAFEECCVWYVYVSLANDGLANICVRQNVAGCKTKAELGNAIHEGARDLCC